MQKAVRKLKVLFLCTGNSCRSQMAEGWARALKGDVVGAYSAGIEKHGMNLHLPCSAGRLRPADPRGDDAVSGGGPASQVMRGMRADGG